LTPLHSRGIVAAVAVVDDGRRRVPDGGWPADQYQTQLHQDRLYWDRITEIKQWPTGKWPRSKPIVLPCCLANVCLPPVKPPCSRTRATIGVGFLLAAFGLAIILRTLAALRHPAQRGRRCLGNPGQNWTRRGRGMAKFPPSFFLPSCFLPSWRVSNPDRTRPGSHRYLSRWSVPVTWDFSTIAVVSAI